MIERTRAQYNIRVMNLSLGHPVGGVLRHRSALWRPSPAPSARASWWSPRPAMTAGPRTARPFSAASRRLGNSPFAITVGALNTWGTTDRSDDTRHRLQLRGPTKFDLARQAGSLQRPGTESFLSKRITITCADHYPVLHRAGSGTNAYMQIERHQHGCADRELARSRCCSRGLPNLGTAQVEDGAADRRDASCATAG